MVMPSMEAIRVAFHQHAVGEGAAVALVGIAADVFLLRARVLERDVGEQVEAREAERAEQPQLAPAPSVRSARTPSNAASSARKTAEAAR